MLPPHCARLCHAAGRAVEDLAAAALSVARLIAGLMPDQPEPLGLLALYLYCEARRLARRGETGLYLPLIEQDRALWDGAMVAKVARAQARALCDDPAVRG